MEFNRKKKRGINQKTRRLWLSAEGYRIVWRKEVYGVSVRPGFQACVQTIVPGNFEGGSTEMWDFVNREKRLHKTMKAAVTECEQHQQLWNQATECTGVRAIQELLGHRPTGVPKWALMKLDRRVSMILMDTQIGHRIEIEEEEPGTSGETPKPETKKKSATRKSVASKRKPRSDKGKKRGLRKGTKK